MRNNPDLQIGIVDWESDGETLRSIREKVFVLEQAVPRHIAWNERDGLASHFLATRHTVALGCARLMPDGKVGRMAVLRQHRGQGIGGQLLAAIIQHAKGRGMRRLHLHAQTHAANFYKDFGFIPQGEEFEEAGIPHQHMELMLQYAGFRQFIAGVSYPEPFASLTVELAASARRQIRIYSPMLDHEVFDNPQLSQALVALARRSRHSDVRILISDSRPMIKQGHQLLTLARRIPSTVHIHKLSNHPELPTDSFVVRDDNGTIYKPNDADRDGFYEPDSRATAKKFADKFDDLWHKSSPDRELRLLRL